MALDDYNRRLMTDKKRAATRWTPVLILALATLLLGGCFAPGTNRPPVAELSVSQREGYEPLEITLSANGSYDPDGDALRYEWDFGDGQTAAGHTVAHSFSQGTYTVTLRILDSQNAEGTATAIVTAREVPEGFVVCHYEWVDEGQEQVWDQLVSWTLYQTYRARLRSPFVDNYDYPAYVIDPLDDPTLADFATVLWNRSGGGYESFVERALAFVQGAIEYRIDDPGMEWPLYPIETLVDKVGDCEDTAIVFVSLLRARGYPSRLAHVDTDGDRSPDHVLALVPVTESYASQLVCGGGTSTGLLMIDDQLYAVAETAVRTGQIPLGCDPWGLSVEDVIQSWSL